MAAIVGFDCDRTLILRLNANDAKVPPAARPVFYERVRQAVAAVPGVSDAVPLLTVPVSSDHWVANVKVSGTPPPAAADAPTFLNAVGPRYFAVFGTPVLAGRGFAAEDRSGAPLVAVVNETFARRYAGGRSPIGETLTFGETGTYSPPFRIVGVAKDSGSAIYFGLREGIPQTVYLSIAQMNPEIANFAPPAAFRIAMRLAAGSPAVLARNASAAINRIAPDMRVDPKSMASFVGDNIATERLTATLSGLFGALSLLLAAVGVYGVVAYTVTQRRPEIGIRLALGAAPAEVVRMMLLRTARLVGAGLVIGACISFWTSRFVAALLFGLESRDPATFALALTVLAAVGLLAGWLPARQAARIDPASALRTE
jgi:putative ABC transport system permease protein